MRYWEHRRYYRQLILILSLGLAPGAAAQAPPSRGLPAGEVHLRITSSRIQKYKIVVAPLTAEGLGVAESSELAARIREIVIDDLDYSLRFDVINRRTDDLAFISLSSAKDRVHFDGWQATGADYLVAGSLFAMDRQSMVDLRVYDLSLKELVFLKNYPLETAGLRRTAHRISDDIVLNVTGEKGVAGTRIAFAMPTSELNAELFYCDYDGYNLTPVTSDSSIAKLPGWSPDGYSLAYTSLKGDVDLYLADLRSHESRLLQAAKGVDMAANWCSRNGFLTFSSGFLGDQEIFYLPPGENKPQRLTFSYAMDTEPFWSPSGDELTFMSTRAGNPHIFIMGADGLNLRRLTFESRNTTPRWRPRPYGDKIVLTTEISGVFQIAIIDITGDNFVQLTTAGENRDPTWSPDGLHIAFISDRRGGRGNFEIFTMDWDGNTQRPLTKGFRKAREPAWSPFLDW
ncbi:MAG: PD40 domain-containing protein [Candidatus Glassbacteria bacterium]|nr:PD40 domain-containing protein [Candidatus Glassbacteria bacterium]